LTTKPYLLVLELLNATPTRQVIWCQMRQGDCHGMENTRNEAYFKYHFGIW